LVIEGGGSSPPYNRGRGGGIDRGLNKGVKGGQIGGWGRVSLRGRTPPD